MKKVLSVMLALVMVLSMSIMVSAATPAANATAVQDGDKVTVTIYGKDGENFATIDYGIAYDTTKVEPIMNAAGEPATWGDAVAAMPLKISGIAMDTYVTLGAAATGDNFAIANDGVIAVVEFKVIGEDAGTISVVADSAEAEISADGTVSGAPVEPTVPEIVEKTPEPEKTPEAPAETPAAPAETPAAPATPATPAPTTAAPKTADTANVVIPVVAIVAAAAAVVVAKKRIEE